MNEFISHKLPEDFRNSIKERIDYSNSPADLPAMIEREQPEPQEGNAPLSLFFVVIICLSFFWAGYYLHRYSGVFNGFVYDENASSGTAIKTTTKPVDMLAEGRRLFLDTCAKCHQNNGQGLPGQYPPLAMSEWVVASGSGRLIRIVLDGMQGPVQVKGETYNNPMLAWRDVLSDQQIAGILTYLRNEKAWGNSAIEVTVEQVADIRQKTKNRAAMGAWTSAELLKLPEVEMPAAVEKISTVK